MSTVDYSPPHFFRFSTHRYAVVPRIKVSKEKLSEVQKNLKKDGYTLDEISEEIGSDFRNFRYKGHSMSLETFRALNILLGERIEGTEINSINGKGERKNLKIPKSRSTAELFGIILGDGYIQSTTRKREDRTISAYRVVITLNEEEKELKRKTSNLLEEITGEEPQVHFLKESNAVQIFLNSKELINNLEGMGLKTGDKVENQVGVPDWIKKDKEYEKACLRGLTDADGTIYQQSRDKRIAIRFKNHSKPLLHSFEEMCSDLGINTSSGGKHTIQIAKQVEVEKFIEKIAPLKASEISF